MWVMDPALFFPASATKSQDKKTETICSPKSTDFSIWVDPQLVRYSKHTGQTPGNCALKTQCAPVFIRQGEHKNMLKVHGSHKLWLQIYYDLAVFLLLWYSHFWHDLSNSSNVVWIQIFPKCDSDGIIKQAKNPF